MMPQTTILLILALIAAAILVAVFIAFYHRPARDVALVRTGLGRRRVVLDGGTLAIPFLHDITRINMNTMRLDVKRTGNDALITKDRLRVDVGVEFHVAVGPRTESVARASQTLGNRTNNLAQLRELIEGQLVDTLRSVAARMNLDELHEKRGEFVREVRDSLDESLLRYGLVLESVSLTALDQTPFAALDENNAFNAVGMRKLAEVVATAKRERAQIETDAEVAVHLTRMEAARRRLEIDLEEEAAKIHQSQELEGMRAAQLAEIAARRAESERAASASRIKMELDIRAADIAREKAVRELEIASEQALELAEQNRMIAIARNSEDESRALAAADFARAEAVKAAEGIVTARALAEAQRKTHIALLSAREDNEISAERLVAHAKAEAEASIDQARSTLQRAKAEAETAQLRISTLRDEMTAKAAGQRALNEAEGVLSSELIALKADLARLEALPKIVEQMVKPAEKIGSLNIHHIGGLASRPRDGGDEGARSPVNQTIDSIMEMAVQLPALKRIGEQIAESLGRGTASSAGSEKPDSPTKA